MTNIISTLLSISSPPLGSDDGILPQYLVETSPHLSNQLSSLLKQKDGFFAFEGALHVFPMGATNLGWNSSTWNSVDLWRLYYGKSTDGLLFFAEDIFGEQFALYQDMICRFDPETGILKQCATTLTGWAERILDNYNLEVGYSIGHDWQMQFEPLQPFQRLLPKTPFILGGKFVTENLYALDSAQGMQLRGGMASELANVPEGAKVVLKVVP